MIGLPSPLHCCQLPHRGSAVSRLCEHQGDDVRQRAAVACVVRSARRYCVRPCAARSTMAHRRCSSSTLGLAHSVPPSTSFVFPHSQKVLDAIADTGVPRIHFGVTTGELLPLISATGADVVGVDERALDAVATGLARKALQGNLDPTVAFAGADCLRCRTRGVAAQRRPSRPRVRWATVSCRRPIQTCSPRSSRSCTKKAESGKKPPDRDRTCRRRRRRHHRPRRRHEALTPGLRSPSSRRLAGRRQDRFRHDRGGGCAVPVDMAADGFLARQPEVVELCHELGLGDDLVSPTSARAFIWFDGALRSIPSPSVLGVPFNTESVRASGLIDEAGLADFEARIDAEHPPLVGDASVGEVLRPRVGDAVFEALIDPLLGGINAGNADGLSINAGAAQLAEAARTGVRSERPCGPRSMRHRLLRRARYSTGSLAATAASSMPWSPNSMAGCGLANRPPPSSGTATVGRW